MRKSKFHGPQVRGTFLTIGLVFLGAVFSIVAQESAPELADPAGELTEETVSLGNPANSPVAERDGVVADRGDEASLPARADIEARLAAATSAASPDDPDSDKIVELYEEALTLFESIAEQESLLKSYVDSLTTAPELTKHAIANLKSISQTSADKESENLAPSGLAIDASVDEINDRLTEERADEAAAKKELEILEEKFSVEQARPGKIRDRISEIQEELAEAEAMTAKLGGSSGAAQVNEATQLKALVQIKALQVELAALEQEQFSYEARLALTDAQRDVASFLAAIAEEETGAVQRFADQRLKDSVNDAALLAEKTKAETQNRPEAIRKIAEHISELADQLEVIDERIAVSSDAAIKTKTRLSDLRRQFDQLKTQLEIGGLREAQGEILLDQRRLVPNQRIVDSDLNDIRQSIAETRLELYQIQEEQQKSPATAATELLQELEDPPAGEVAEAVMKELVPLIEKRNELLEELGGQYRRLLAEDGDYDGSLRELSTLTAEVDEFLSEKLIWVRSSDPINISTFKELPGGFAWLFDPDRLPEVLGALSALWKRSAALVVFLVALVFIMLLTQSGCKKKITDLGHKVQKISTDEYKFTFKAFLLTVLLALPFPIVLALFGWGLVKAPDISDWLHGLGEGLLMSGYLLFVVLFFRAICRVGGLAEQHFRWRRQPLDSVRKNVTWISVFYISFAIVARMTLRESGAVHLSSLGRLSFILMMLLVAFFIRRMFDEKSGVTALIIQDHPQHFVARFQKFWVFLLVSFPLILAILAIAGYTLTGFSLTRQFRLTIEFIGIGMIVYAMILRWFSLRERKLSLEQRIRERKERLEAEAREAKGGEDVMTEEGGLSDLDEESIDFEAVGEQTRRLLRFVVGAGVGLAIWFGWTDVVPALRGLDSIKIAGGISLGAIIPAIFVIIVTTIGAKNLPGLLEIGVLRHLPIDAGLRYAITSLCQYIVVAIGIAMTVAVVGMDWSKLGWIAAALSVGLGFGLQEIVANFVCGIILLFERPIRVGDVVTVSNTTGVVSKIRIRATTILDRDQKEFIVPNKEFITGSILNWTLSTTLNRVVIVVGVAYGSDTRRARELLLEICNAHPDVLKDPATNVVFDAFGDSTLNFTVRTYLASMENRLGVTNDLHHEIHERFGAEGIEIAFPQMDLHLRSVDPGVQFGGGGSNPADDKS